VKNTKSHADESKRATVSNPKTINLKFRLDMFGRLHVYPMTLAK